MRGLRAIRQLDQLVGIAGGDRDTYLRYSAGPGRVDARHTSRDDESGLSCRGYLLCRWHRRAGGALGADWLARQVCKYAQLGEGDADRCAWILTGRVVGRGPDHEPLVADPKPLAILSDSVVYQARSHYHEHFEVGLTHRAERLHLLG